MGDLKEALPGLMELVTTWGIKVLGALAVLAIGRMIAGLMRRIDRSATALSFADVEGLESVVADLNA